MKIGVIIQARLSSSRLPGKVLLPLPKHNGIPAIQHTYNRCSEAFGAANVVVATSTEQSDNELVEFCEQQNIPVFRGSLANVLSRYYECATQYNFDVVVRITGDCPCLDVDLLKYVVNQHVSNSADFTSSAIKRTYPHGMDVGVMNYNALKEAYENSTQPHELEHVTAYFYKTAPEQFNIQLLEAPVDWNFPNYRLTLDTPLDYIFLNEVFEALYAANPFFGWTQIQALLQEKDYLATINSTEVQKKVCSNLQEELQELLKLATTNDLNRAVPLIQQMLKNQ